ncbi:unannotated protein [freshwater metagenome]|uniref:Unannotated protein n=1 Tax=freshwater metagenome TaxID=449393 RepID=A0A6J5ZA97_9ZZZZ|nr:hypothetical protein [Actinomycetota bacterium]
MPDAHRSVRPILLGAVLAVAVAMCASGTSVAAPAHIVTDLNHVTTVTTEVKAQKLYNALIALKLPSAWPFASYSAISSGGVRFGNVNVELGAGTSPSAGNQFVTFQPPSLTGLTAALDERGIEHGPPTPITAGSKLLYTLIELPSYSQANRLTAQFCVYNFPNGRPTRVAPPNRAGIVNVSRVVINAKNPSSWEKLFAPSSPSAGGVYRLPGGPLVQLQRGRRNSVSALDVRVKNVAAAVLAFRAVGISARGHVANVGSLRLRLLAVSGSAVTGRH